MKRILFSVITLVTGFACVTSCQKEAIETNEAPAKEPSIMTVNAESVATKTFVEEVSATEYNLKWSEGDAIACYEVSTVESVATVQGKVTSTALAADAASASFTMDFSGNDGDPNFSYIFVYPAAKYTKNGEVYRAQIPDKQTFSATSFDKNADVLISRAITDQTTRPTTVDAEFERIGATALMNIKAPTTTETIRSITFSTTETSAYLAGYVKVYPLTGTHDTEIYSGGSDGRTLTLTPASSTTYTGTIPVWFRLGEITLSDNFTVVVTTNKKIYTKTVDLATAGRTLEFNNAGLTKFNVNMTTVDGVDNPSLDDDDYYIVMKYSGNYYAMSSVASGTRLASVQLDDFDPDATCYTGSDDDLVWTITNDGDAITIEHGTGTYLSVGSGNGSATTSTTKKTYTLATGSTSGTKLLNSVDDSGFGLRYNSGNKWFAFHNTSVSATMIGDIYFMPKDPRTRVAAPTNVDAAASGTSIIVTWYDASDANIDHYLVTLSGAANDSQTVDVGVEGYEFTGLSDGTYSISVEAVPSNTTLYLNSLPETVSNLGIGTQEYYTKVTSAPASWEGTYLIVYETGNVALTGSATTAATIKAGTSVSISDSKIVATSAMDAIAITISTNTDSGYVLQTNSGYYIYNTSSSSNGFSANTDLNTAKKYAVTLAIDASGNATITAAGSYLRYNTGSSIFNYYKSSTYSSQAAIQLYKRD